MVLIPKLKNVLQRVNLVSQCCIQTDNSLSSDEASKSATEWIDYLKTKLDKAENEHRNCQQHQNHLKMQIEDLLRQLAVAYASHPELQGLLADHLSRKHVQRDPSNSRLREDR